MTIPPDPVATDQATILEVVSQLPQLQDLHLELRCNAPDQPLSDVPACQIRSFSHLSALTTLRHLQLDCSYCARDEHDWSRSSADQVDERELWAAQRQVLVAALRHMPHLLSFASITFSLTVSELEALTSLTDVQLAGMEPHGPTEQQQQQRPAAMGPGTAMGANTAARGPHQLEQLRIAPESCALRALACLGAFPLLRYARAGVLCFGLADVAPGSSQLLPDTLQVVRRAVRALADVWARGRVDGMGRPAWDSKDPTLLITTSAVPGLLLPPAAAPLPASPAGGHATWLRELGPLGALGQWVQLWGLALTAEDLPTIADTFPDAKVRHVSTPVLFAAALIVPCRTTPSRRHANVLLDISCAVYRTHASYPAAVSLFHAVGVGPPSQPCAAGRPAMPGPHAAAATAYGARTAGRRGVQGGHVRRPVCHVLLVQAATEAGGVVCCRAGRAVCGAEVERVVNGRGRRRVRVVANRG